MVITDKCNAAIVFDNLKWKFWTYIHSIDCITLYVIEMVVLSLVGSTLIWATTMERAESVNYLFN